MIRIYTAKKCKHCKKLKKLLEEEGYDYVEVDIDDDKNRDECQKVFDFAGVTLVPIILKKPHALIPTRSFNTIEQAIDLIKSFD
jgi:glutaredoxin